MKMKSKNKAYYYGLGYRAGNDWIVPRRNPFSGWQGKAWLEGFRLALNAKMIWDC